MAGMLLLMMPALSLAAIPKEGGISSIGAIVYNLLLPIWEAFIGFAIVAFIIAGFKFLTAQGNPAELSIARKAVIWGMVGVTVAILGFSIQDIIEKNLTGTNYWSQQ